MSAREGRSEEPVREENLPHRPLYVVLGAIGRPAACAWPDTRSAVLGSSAGALLGGPAA